MKKIFNVRNLSLMLVVAIVSVFTIANVNAADSWDNTSQGSVTVQHTIHNATNHPTPTYTLTVTPDSNNQAGANNPPTGGTIVFTGSETITSGNVSQTGTISFTGMTFDRPGDYKYTIQETATDDNNYPRDTKTYDVFISVRNKTNADGTPTGEYDIKIVEKDGDTKVTELDYESTSAMTDLTISKIVTGTGADMTKYFPVTFTVTGESGDTYPITGLDANATCDGVSTQPSSVTSGTAVTVCLKHGQSAVVGNNNGVKMIPVGGSWTASEPNDTTYTENYTVNGGTKTTGQSTGSQTIADNTGETVQFDNNYESSALTGVLLNVIPYILVIVIAVSGTLIYTALKQKKENA